MPPGLAICDCAPLWIATGLKAATLAELRERLAAAPVESIDCHLRDALLLARVGERDEPNDFAAWAARDLRDPVLAERLSVLDPAADPEDLRREILERIEERLDEAPHRAHRPAERELHLLRAELLIFDMGERAASPADLARRVPGFARGTLFYHLVDARRRDPEGRDDLARWLAGRDDAPPGLVEALAGIDPWAGSLEALGARLTALFEEHFGGEAGG